MTKDFQKKKWKKRKQHDVIINKLRQNVYFKFLY